MKLKYKKNLYLIFVVFCLLSSHHKIAASEDLKNEGQKTTYHTFQFHSSSSEDYSSEGGKEELVALAPATPNEDKEYAYPTPFLEWMEKNLIIQPELSTSTKVAGITGLIIGVLASYASAPLSGDFGVLILNLFNNKNYKAQEAVYIISALIAIFPAMALNGVPSKHQLQSWVASYREANLSENEGRLLKALKIAAYFICPFSGVSLGYVAYQATKIFPLPITILLTGASYIGCYMFTVASQKRLSESIFNYLTRGEVALLQRKRLQETVIQSMKAISQMPEEGMEPIYKKFFDVLGDLATNPHHNLIKLRELLEAGKQMEPLTPQSKYHEMGAKAAHIIGGVIGGTEVYITYVLAQSSVLLLCNAVGIHDPTTQTNLAKTVAVLACIPWGSLYIDGVSGRFSRIFNSFFNKDRVVQKEFVNPTIRKGIFGYSIFGGSAAAIPSTYLAIQVTEGLPLWLRIVFSSFTFFSTSTVLSEALEEILDQGLTWMKGLQEDSPHLRREKLLNVLQTLFLKIDGLPDAMVDSLDHHLSASLQECLSTRFHIDRREAIL